MPLNRYVVALLASISTAASLAATPLSGQWDATVHIDAIEVPFKFGIAVKGEQATGWFFNGAQKVVSSSGTIHDGHLVLEFDSYAKRLDVKVAGDGSLAGTYASTTVGSTATPAAFQAHRAGLSAAVKPDADVPSIAGLWLVPAQSEKAGEKAWQFIVRQSGTQISAAILRVDGDTGALDGHWQHGKLVLSHFDGARPSLIDVTRGDGETLKLVLHSSNGSDQSLTAYRSTEAQARGLPQASDPAKHTAVKDANEPFRFSFPDLNGHTISNSDSRFRGKVLVVDIAGSWCPNCHDEAPFLQSLYRKYHSRGLEIVTLSFEDPEQYANPVRLRAFIKDFGLQYTVLLAGTTRQLHEKLPQAVDLDAYPTTFFVGRDGLVHGSYAGFAAAATGDFNTRLKAAFTAEIEKLLAQKATSVATAGITGPAQDLRAVRR